MPWPISVFQKRLCLSPSLGSTILCACRTHTARISAALLMSTIPQTVFRRRDLHSSYHSKSTSVEGVQVYNTSPASYGFVSYAGYQEIIPVGTSLPHKRSIILNTAFDYIQADTFPVAYQHNLWDGFSEISRVTLTNIRSQPADITKLYATMKIDQTLKGSFHVRDPSTKSEATVQFDARVPPPRPLRLKVDKIGS